MYICKDDDKDYTRKCKQVGMVTKTSAYTRTKIFPQCDNITFDIYFSLQHKKVRQKQSVEYLELKCINPFYPEASADELQPVPDHFLK